ncbi:MAG: hypothetical protein O7H41_11830 [Planctomycetota bacterium]|nr:hypothetical protein [Planctomycetota bacterium]
MSWEILRSRPTEGSPPARMRRIAIGEVVLGVLLLLTAYVLLLLDVGTTATWFYALAWWPTIVALDGLNFLLAGESLILSRRRTFLLLLPLSVTLWLIFEVCNFRLQNWSYVSAPRMLMLRWTGMTVCFATVLPAIFEIADLLQALRWPLAVRVRPLKPGPRLRMGFVVVGAGFLISPLLFPTIAFPLIWGAFFFLLEPWLYQRGRKSLLREWEYGSLLTVTRLLIAGLITGGLWEFFNFWAGSKWIYTVPHLDGWKIFEMPILGFLGFPPFALECFVMSEAAPLIVSFTRRGWKVALLVLLILAFWLAAFAGIDRFTVTSYETVRSRDTHLMIPK